MIRVSVEVCSGATTFRATVWAESIEVAVGLARARYPGAEATVVFPIEPEAFFAKSSQIDSDTILPETMKQAG